MTGQSEFPYQEMRSLLFDYLSANLQGDFSRAVAGVIALAKSRGLYSGSDGKYRIIGGTNYDLTRHDYKRVPEEVRQLFWQFLVQGILVFGHDDLNPNWPWYRVTDYGEQILRDQAVRPYDPDAFLKEFEAKNPEVDQVVVSYLDEAVRTFNTGCYKAAAVMLGCASEQLIVLLHSVFEDAIPDARQKETFAKSYRWTISSKFQALRNGLEKMIGSGNFPKELAEAVKTDLVGVFELIRRIRNSAGHPDLPKDLRRETVFLSLAVFPEYTRQVLRLTQHFTNPPSEL